MQNGRAKIRDVARLSGVSIATVSRVLNKTAKCSPETEEAVLRAVKELGYVPSQSAKSLRTNASNIVGILASDLTYEYVNETVTLFERLLLDKGYPSILCNSGRLTENENFYLDILFSLNICALVVFSSGKSVQLPERLNIPVIYLNRNPSILPENELCCAVETDNFSAGYLAAGELLDRGCQRIAAVDVVSQLAPSQNVAPPKGRTLGFFRALWERGILYDETARLTVDENSYAAGYAAIEAALKADTLLDGYFFQSDILALGALNCLEKHGIAVPERVKLIGCNNMAASTYTAKPITTIRHKTEAMCQAAVDNLELMLRGETPPQRRLVFDVEVIRRATT